MPHTVFYSWQSDLPNSVNRGFIKDALQKALKELGRDDVTLDMDTQDVSGSPPIADTILKKIEECAVFVPDLTFVAKTEEKRPVSNPNVLIEYGWARAKVGHSRIVAVMNSAYGEPSEKSVPFDLRHHRWPTQYCLEPDADKKTKTAEKKKLVSALKTEIEAVLKEVDVLSPEPASVHMQPKKRVSCFLDDGDVLGTSPSKPVGIPWQDGPQMFIHVIPTVPTSKRSPAELLQLMKNGNTLRPLAEGTIYPPWDMGNKFGAVRYETKHEESIDRIIQVGAFGDIWAVDGFTLKDCNVVPFFEVMYARALATYLTFARDSLQVQSPVTVIAGMSEVLHKTMFVSPSTNSAVTEPAVEDDIVEEIKGVTLNPPENVPLARVFSSQMEQHAYYTLMPLFKEALRVFPRLPPDHLPT